jgi:ribonuclease D
LELRILTTDREVEALATELAALPEFGLDLESDGLFAYRAKVCTVQVALSRERVAVVDARAVSIAPLAGVLGKGGPVKIVHDVGFDARLLAEAGLVIGNVHDTAICARMLGRTATGLAGVLASELKCEMDKSMQQHDWRIRPLDAKMLAYLAADVVHLGALRGALFAEAEARGAEDAVLEETRYRIATSVESATRPDPRPAYVRVKGIERAGGPERAIVRVLAALREQEAERRDVPPHRVASAEALLAIARARPATVAQLRKVRGLAQGTPEAEAFAAKVCQGVAEGLAAGDIPPEDRSWFERPTIPGEVAATRRARERNLTVWRKARAAERGVDEQVVLPGHCLKAVAALEVADEAGLARVPGLGAFRLERDGRDILDALLGEPVPAGEAR